MGQGEMPMRAFFAPLLAAVAVFVGVAQARMIESGLYYNSSEPGRGFSIEQQGGVVTLIFYIYDSAGAPVWYFASGVTMLNATGYPTLATGFSRYSGGQCLGCTYTAPATTTIGTLSLAFSSPVAATLNIGAGAFGAGAISIALSRYGFTDAANPLLGQWAWTFAVGSTPTFSDTYGGFVRFTTLSAQVNPGGTGFVSGSPSGYGAECYTSGSLAGQCLMVFVGSSGYAETYQFPTPINELAGTWRLGTGSSATRYRMKGLRVGVPGEPTLLGTGTLPDASRLAAEIAPDEDISAIEAGRRAAVHRAGGIASTSAADGELASAAATLAARIRFATSSGR
jgi:hypothetical protein